MELLVCGVVTGFRLRQMLPTKLRTPAAVGLLAAAALGLELFVGNLNLLATHGYTPIDLRPYLTADADPTAPIVLNDENTTLQFIGLDFPIYNLQLDGLVSLADGDTPEQKNVRLNLNVSATDEAATASRQSWNWPVAAASARSWARSLDLSGKADSLTLTAAGFNGEYRSYPLNAQLNTVYANARRPLDFSALRFAVVLALLSGGLCPAPGISCWRDAYAAHERKYRPAVLAVELALCAAAFLAPFGDRFNAGIATNFYNTADWSVQPHRLHHTHQRLGVQRRRHPVRRTGSQLFARGDSIWKKTRPRLWLTLPTPTTPPPGRTPRRMPCGMWPTTMAATTSILALYRVFCSSCPLRH